MPSNVDRRRLLAGLPAMLAAPAALRSASAQTVPAAQAVQAPGFYRFQLGGFGVTTVHDGFRTMPVQGFIKNAPLAEVQQVLGESFLPADTYYNIYTATLVDTGRHLVLFDTGNGAQPVPTMGRLRANLVAAGIDPARIDTVVLSHFHGDHVNGLLDAQGEAAFPNAELVVPAAEWAWWSDGGNETRTPDFQRPNFANSARRLAPYARRMRRIGGDAEVVPGIRGHAAHGHTPGHMVFHIADGAAEMMYVADTCHRPELTARRPEFHTIFDFDPDAAAVTRRRVYDRVAADRIRITGFHFPFPAMGHLAREDAGYRFVPADWASTT